jgi:DNA-binding transcriptional MocR family regulator
VAHAILKVAAKFNLIIVEDDPFADLPTTGSNLLATLDQLNNVISVGTFPKTLSASLRSGFNAARIDRIAAIAGVNADDSLHRVLWMGIMIGT